MHIAYNLIYESIVGYNVDLIYISYLEFPEFTIEPEAKARLEGESMKLCCTAAGIPDISYYEW